MMRGQAYLGFDTRGKILVRENRTHSTADPACNAQRRLGETYAGAGRNNARKLRNALLGIGTRRERQD